MMHTGNYITYEILGKRCMYNWFIKNIYLFLDLQIYYFLIIIVLKPIATQCFSRCCTSFARYTMRVVHTRHAVSLNGKCNYKLYLWLVALKFRCGETQEQQQEELSYTK